MTITCEPCGIDHASAAEADEMHAASKRVRRWFRGQIIPPPISKPSMRPASAQPVENCRGTARPER